MRCALRNRGAPSAPGSRVGRRGFAWEVPWCGSATGYWATRDRRRPDSHPSGSLRQLLHASGSGRRGEGAGGGGERQRADLEQRIPPPPMRSDDEPH
jgi:hypothetical protein